MDLSFLDHQLRTLHYLLIVIKAIIMMNSSKPHGFELPRPAIEDTEERWGAGDEYHFQEI